MKTPDKPRSSKSRDKAEESAPNGDTPMGRFRDASAGVFSVAPEQVRAAEAAEKAERKKPKG